MFHLGIWEVLEEYVADLVGNIGAELLIGRKPIGTCDHVSEDDIPIAIGTHIPSALSESFLMTNF